jgi:hypothetical protein
MIATRHQQTRTAKRALELLEESGEVLGRELFHALGIDPGSRYARRIQRELERYGVTRFGDVSGRLIFRMPGFRGPEEAEPLSLERPLRVRARRS